MDFSKTTQIASKLTEIVGELDLRSEEIQPYIVLKKEQLHPACQWLHESPDYYFDYLQCITAADTGPEKGILELWYHLNSIPFGINLILKVELPRGDEENLPEIDTLSDIWKTADWHEREAFDLVGVKFKNHPDLRRILLPADWVGHPLRKDHVEQELYHGIKIKY